MNRIKITLSNQTTDLLNATAQRKGISKSNYIERLINEDYKKSDLDSVIVKAISDIDVDLRALVCRDEFSAEEKLMVIEYAKDIKDMLKNIDSKEGATNGVYK